MSERGKKNQPYASIVAFFLGIFIPLFYLFSLYSLTNSCAQQRPLQGGPRDTIPPQLIEELSTPNFQTNFQKQTIELAFDEYIEIQNVVKQVVVSPPLQGIPQVKRKKGFKTAQFFFPEKEELKENVTYAINFGESIKDLTEGNEVENLQFLFSTGDYIDSLSLSGKVVDAVSGKPVEDVLFMLYDVFADSVVRTQTPYYFGRTDKDGQFTINYLKAGAFKGFALEDKNLDYLFNVPAERIGFLTDTVFVKDSSENITIQIFEEQQALNKPKLIHEQRGLAKLVFRRKPYTEELLLKQDLPDSVLYQKINGDTLDVWYHSPDSADWNFYWLRDTIVDTLRMKFPQKSYPDFALRRQRNSEATIPVNPFKQLKIDFSLPIKQIDTSFIKLHQLIDSTVVDTAQGLPDAVRLDSMVLIPDSSFVQMDSLAAKDSIKTTKTEVVQAYPFALQTDTTDRRTLLLLTELPEGAKLRLTILPGGITDWFGRINPDTVLLNYEIKTADDFGNIKLTLTELDSTQTYWCELLLNKNVVTDFSVKNTSTFQQQFTGLLPGDYSLRIVEDYNDNQRWDTGNYDLQLQPERINIATFEKLRPGWDVEEEIKLEQR